MTVLGPAHDDDRLLEERARSLARPVEAASATATAHVVVRVGDQALALPARQLRQVTAIAPITLAPSPLDAVVGVLPLRGHIVAAVDLAVVLGLSAVSPLQERAVVVVDDGAEGTALLVDAIDGLQDLDGDPETVDPPLSGELTRASDAGPRRLSVDALLQSLDGPSQRQHPDSPEGHP